MVRRLTRISFFAVMLTFVAFSASAYSQARQAESKLQYIPENACLVFQASPTEVFAAPDFEFAPIEILEAVSQQALGVNIPKAHSIIGFVEVPGPQPPLKGGLIVRFSAPQTLGGAIETEGEKFQIGSKAAFRTRIDGIETEFFMPNNKTLLVAFGNQVADMALSNLPQGRLAEELLAFENGPKIQAAFEMTQVRAWYEEIMEREAPVERMTPMLARLILLPDQIDFVRASVSFNNGSVLTLSTESRDEATAAGLENSITQSIAYVGRMVSREIAREVEGSDEPNRQAQALLAYIKRATEVISAKLTPVREGNRLTLTITERELTNQLIALSAIPFIEGLQRGLGTSSVDNKLRQIGIAMHNYHDVHTRFPGNQQNPGDQNLDQAGKGLSWRVHILPYIEEVNLYNQFRMDEPWDSEHNLALAEQIPDVYKSTKVKDKLKTRFVRPIGEGAIFEQGRGSKIASITDGTSNTIMLVECEPDSAVIWTKPDDIEFDPDNPFNGLGQNGFRAIFADGSLHKLPRSLTAETLRLLILRNDGNVVEIPDEGR